ncbi:uncharacterized protein F4812DRAFT_372679 [Daldinia caldariorum]|uniref:uncharacterized protein n=1 Tax=Daldinia caldariorum TaxID=326644 RepID=UPI002007F92E|nr:uncharacterized protein F4812DRAFT_372679 [Daldinia caldariorum]KAI1468541.1 hypothetical protein F4812DRAFT_372679 [Daldinia caldariorum]
MAVSHEVAQKIINKKNLYCQLVDTDQYQRVAGEFMLSDATSTWYSDGKIMNDKGVELNFSSALAMTKYCANRFKNSQCIHAISPPHLEQIGPDEVKAVFIIRYDYGPKGSNAGKHCTGGGYYHERYVRKGEDWFLKDMKMYRTYEREV